MDAVHPSDRNLVETWASSVRGRVLDAGCGPGQWTHFLSELGADVYGIDLVPEFLERARSSYPGLRFEVQSIDAIEESDNALGGILAWFSTIHYEPGQVQRPLDEFSRVLRPGGLLALGYFEAAEVGPFDHAVLRAYRWPADEIQRRLEQAGFDVLESHRRGEQGQRPVGAVICRLRDTLDGA